MQANSGFGMHCIHRALLAIAIWCDRRGLIMVVASTARHWLISRANLPVRLSNLSGRFRNISVNRDKRSLAEPIIKARRLLSKRRPLDVERQIFMKHRRIKQDIRQDSARYLAKDLARHLDAVSGAYSIQILYPDSISYYLILSLLVDSIQWIVFTGRYPHSPPNRVTEHSPTVLHDFGRMKCVWINKGFAANQLRINGISIKFAGEDALLLGKTARKTQSAR